MRIPSRDFFLCLCFAGLNCLCSCLPDVADGTGEGFLAGMNPLVKVVLSLEEEREREWLTQAGSLCTVQMGQVKGFSTV